MRYLTLIIILFAAHSRAVTLSKQGVGFGFTDNVYLTNEDRKSDGFAVLDSRTNLFGNSNDLNLKLIYTDFFKENSSDNLYLSLSAHVDKQTLAFGDFELTPRLFHRNYLREQVATSDVSFTHTGLGLDASKEVFTDKNYLSIFTPTYEIKHFANFAGRVDHQVSGIIDFEFSSIKAAPYIFGGFGLVRSSLSEYSKNYFDFGGGASGDVTPVLDWIFDLNIRNAIYTDRTISQSMIVVRRGTTRTSTLTEKERTETVTASGGVIWHFHKVLDLESKLTLITNTSNNPDLEYSNTEALFVLRYFPN